MTWSVPLIRQKLPNMQRLATYLETSEKARQFSNFGPVERLFAERLSVAAGLNHYRRLVLASSGHTALMAAYAVLGVRRLVVPAFTFESTRAAATLQGIEPVICDVDPVSGCLTVEILKQLDPASYDGVVAVCALSTVPDLDALSRFCRDQKKRLIVDGAATWGTPGLANYGDAFCYSFHATKTLPAGEGGAVIVNAEHYEHALAFTNFGRTIDKRTVIADGLAMNAKLCEFAAAAGLTALDDLDDELLLRFRNAKRYREALGPCVPPSWDPHTIYAFMPTFAPTKEKAQAIRTALSSDGIPHLAYYVPIAPLPVSVDLYERSICLPVHSDVPKELIDRIGNIFQDAISC